MSFVISKTSNILFGDAGISDRMKESGYLKTLCCMDEKGNYVDLHLTKEHLKYIKEYLNKQKEI